MINIKHPQRLPRTKEAKIFEAVTVILLLIMWTIVLRICTTHASMVPTHYDINGVADSYGGTGDVILISIVGTLSALLFTIGSYYPKWLVNVPVRIDTPRKVALMSRMCRVASIEMALMSIVIALSMGEYIHMGNLINIMLIIVFATILGFCIAAVRSK